MNMFDFWEEPSVVEYKVITKFNEDEIISVEVIESDFAGVVERFYVAQGYGVVVEDQQ